MRLPPQAAVEPIPLAAGDRVRLNTFNRHLDRWWWTVQAVSQNFVACVHQQPFASAETFCYTVLDWRNGVRGPCDLVGQGYGDGSYSPIECAEMLAEFEHTEVFDAKLRAADGPLPCEPTLEVSHRNRMRLEVLEVRHAAVAA